MYSLRYKLQYMLCVSIIGVQTVFGDIDASKYYADHTRTFLGYLGCKNSTKVPIRKMSQKDPRYNFTTPGYTNGIAIYLNEDLFARNYCEGVSLFACAHEAAHYVLCHPYQIKRDGSEQSRQNILRIETEADLIAARMLCDHGYYWIVKQQVDDLWRSITSGLGEWTDEKGEHPTVQQRFAYLSQILQMNEKANKYRDKQGCVYTNNQPPGSRNNTLKRDSLREDIQEIKNILRDFKNMSQEYKMALTGIIGMTIIGWLNKNINNRI